MCLLCLWKLSRHGSKELHGLTADRRIKLTSCLRAWSDVFWVFEVFSDYRIFHKASELLLVAEKYFAEEEEKSAIFSVCICAIRLKETHILGYLIEANHKGNTENGGVWPCKVLALKR